MISPYHYPTDVTDVSPGQVDIVYEPGQELVEPSHSFFVRSTWVDGQQDI
jgi:hypothetical protein